MWLEKVRLENIKCFDEIELEFTRRKKPCRWVTLLGENGVGKSTILQSIGLLLAGPEAAKELAPRPEGWVCDNSKLGQLVAHIQQEEGDTGKYAGDMRTRTRFSYGYFVTGDKKIDVPIGDPKKQHTETYTEPALIEKSQKELSWLREHAFASDTKGWFAVGYGSFRRLTRTSQILIPRLENFTRASNFITQFNEDSALSSFERWLVYLDFRLAKDKNDQKARKMREVGEKVITKLLPKNIEIVEVTSDGLINFRMNGQIVPTINLSDGFRSVIALAGDLIWRIMQAFPDMNDPTQASGVVLIDELDIHLHPIWQRDISKRLREIFPNLQFIVATHSPLVAIGAGQDALTLRLQMNQMGQVEVERIEDISMYDVEEVLKSPAFGLVSTYSPEIQQKIEQYHQLRFNSLAADKQLSEADKKLLDELTLFMKKLQLVDSEPGSLTDRINRFLSEN